MDKGPPASFDDAIDRIQARHLEQLSKLDLADAPPEGQIPNPYGVSLEILKHWTKEQKAHIDDALQNRVFGGSFGSSINWENAFFAFMESSGAYLRDWGKVKEAVDTFNNGNGDVEKAQELLNDSTKDIAILADLWGLEFQVICDLVDDASLDQPKWDGPYCAGFFSKDDRKGSPFIGLAFKGTNPTRKSEVRVDWNYQLRKPDTNIVFGSEVSAGVYTGIFGNFKEGIPFDLITKALQNLGATIPNSTEKPIATHVTGHSLGGSYSSLCFAELLRRTEQAPIPNIALGDLYTLGSPRIGGDNFANVIAEHMGQHDGSAWRIVNGNDIVPQVPPIKGDLSEDIFVHMDAGWKIFPDQEPKEITSERGTKPPPGPFPHWKKLTDHCLNMYYKSLVNAME
ncbi:hypothetical protein MMC20_003008 [Loxospora ochrophaea]|nr:hypothetical protein [Loxospora ochrophaea]